MSGPKIELDAALWARVRQHVLDRGYSSPEEFVHHAIERELNLSGEQESEQDAGKIRGIGYIDAGLDI
jgi:hypothetical protein